MRIRILLAVALAVLLSGNASTDELTLMVEQDLERLGYGPGPVDGEETIDTTVAITKFQAENNLEITGEVTPDLARALMSAQPSGTATASATAAAPPEPDPAALQAAQQACLQQKVAEAQAAQQKKRGFGRLLSAVTREAARAGNYDLARTTSDIYSASATADDLSAAAKDLGLTEDDIAACQNPPM
jgi:peptidoglycan hydrolase-like protein with peptidoglycan-binding domain